MPGAGRTGTAVAPSRREPDLVGQARVAGDHGLVRGEAPQVVLPQVEALHPDDQPSAAGSLREDVGPAPRSVRVPQPHHAGRVERERCDNQPRTPPAEGDMVSVDVGLRHEGVAAARESRPPSRGVEHDAVARQQAGQYLDADRAGQHGEVVRLAPRNAVGVDERDVVGQAHPSDGTWQQQEVVVVDQYYRWRGNGHQPVGERRVDRPVPMPGGVKSGVEERIGAGVMQIVEQPLQSVDGDRLVVLSAAVRRDQNGMQANAVHLGRPGPGLRRRVGEDPVARCLAQQRQQVRHEPTGTVGSQSLRRRGDAGRAAIRTHQNPHGQPPPARIPWTVSHGDAPPVTRAQCSPRAR